MKTSKEQERLLSYHTRQVTVHYKSLRSSNSQVPCINLSGIWLDDLGFTIGQKVNIIVRQHLLIIELPLGKDKEDLDYKMALLEVKKQLKKLTK